MFVDKKLATKKILIVDSHAHLRDMAKSALRSVGFENVELVKDGKEAFAYLQKQRVNLVVTDLEMPNMDGIELVEAIRSDPNLAKTQILLTSDSGDKERLKAAIVAGVNDVLAKPYVSGIFLNKVVKNIR